MTEKKKDTLAKKEERSGLNAMLSQFGLTDTDARIYILLLERGLSFGGSKIAARLSLHRQYVHNSLRKLLSLGLIEEIPVGARVQYKALPPQYLTSVARKQLENAERVAHELERISSVGAEQDFEVYRGTRQIFTFEEELVHSIKENETQYIIGGGAEAFITFYGDQYEPLSLVAKNKGLISKYVGCQEEIPWLNRAQAAHSKFEYRILPTLPKTIVQTVIRLDSVTFYTFGNPPLVYIVKSKTVADDYKKFFDMLWHMASKT